MCNGFLLSKDEVPFVARNRAPGGAVMGDARRRWGDAAPDGRRRARERERNPQESVGSRAAEPTAASRRPGSARGIRALLRRRPRIERIGLRIGVGPRARAPRNRPPASQTRRRWTVVVRLDWIGWIGLVGWLVFWMDSGGRRWRVDRRQSIDRRRFSIRFRCVPPRRCSDGGATDACNGMVSQAG